MGKTLTILAVGDLILAGPQPDLHFQLATPLLKTADLVVGQGEAPFTYHSPEKYYLEVPTEIFATPSCDPSNMAAFAKVCFYVITLPGNHTLDFGAPGTAYTIQSLP